MLTRVVRHAITNNIFFEPSPGYVTHTSLSLLLAQSGNPVRGVVGHQSEVVFPAVSRMVETHEKYGTSDEVTTHSPFNVAFETPLRALEWIARDPVRSERFAESMKSGASSGTSGVADTVAAFDWQGLGDGLVVDVRSSVTTLNTVRTYSYCRSGAPPAKSARLLLPLQPSSTSLFRISRQ